MQQHTLAPEPRAGAAQDPETSGPTAGIGEAVLVGAVLPTTALAHTLGFQPLPGGFFAALAVMVACYLGLIEIGKHYFYRLASTPAQTPGPGAASDRQRRRHLRRRAARFSTTGQLPADPSSPPLALHG